MLRGIVQFDTLNEVNIRLSDGSKAFNYDGYTNIIFKVLKADGTAYIDSEGENVIATSPVDGIITVNLTGQSTTAAGLCQSVLEVYSGDGKMTTARFNYEVFEDLDLDEAVESTTEYPALQNLMLDLSELEARITEAEAARASAASGYVAKAEAAAKRAEDAKAAAESIVGGEYASVTYVNSRAAEGVKEAKAYVDNRVGHKPIGTYAGDGSDATRTINIGGTGNAIVIRIHGIGAVWIINGGGIMHNGSTISVVGGEKVRFENGVLTISANNDLLNAAGVNYTYQVL